MESGFSVYTKPSPGSRLAVRTLVSILCSPHCHLLTSNTPTTRLLLFLLSSFLPLFLSSSLPLSLSSFLPFFLSSFLPFFLLPFFLSSFLPFFLSSFLPFFLSSFLPFFLSSFLVLSILCSHRSVRFLLVLSHPYCWPRTECLCPHSCAPNARRSLLRWIRDWHLFILLACLVPP
jgi:hypothetical protein